MLNKKATMEPIKRENGEMASQKKSSLLKQQLNFIKEKVLPTLWRMKEARPFLMLVDPVEHNMPDYFDIISFPRDLGTIRSRLIFNFYQNLNECFGDFEQMFRNVLIYFSPFSSVFIQANILEAALITLLRGMPKNETKERTIPTTSRPQNANVPPPVETAPDVPSNTKIKQNLEKSKREILASKGEEPSSVAQKEDKFKIPIQLARKRMCMDRSSKRLPKLHQPGNGALLFSTVTSNQAISPNNVGSPKKWIFQTKWVGNETNRCQTNLSDKGLKTFLDFIYCSKLDTQNTNITVAAELLKISHGKQIQTLEKVVKDLLLAKPDYWFDFEASLHLFLHYSKLDGYEDLRVKLVNTIRLKREEMGASNMFQELLKTDTKSAIELIKRLSCIQ